VGAFPFHPLCEGRQAALERLLRLTDTSGARPRDTGGIETPMRRPWGASGEQVVAMLAAANPAGPSGRLGSPQEIAETITFPGMP
jgi:hypothetical protein